MADLILPGLSTIVLAWAIVQRFVQMPPKRLVFRLSQSPASAKQLKRLHYALEIGSVLLVLVAASL